MTTAQNSKTEQKTIMETLCDTVKETLDELYARKLVHGESSSISAVFTPLQKLYAHLQDAVGYATEKVSSQQLTVHFNKVMPDRSKQERTDLIAAQSLADGNMEEISALLHKANELITKLDEEFRTKTDKSLALAQHAIKAKPFKLSRI